MILAAALKHCGGRLISIEHDEKYAAVIQNQVSACGLSDVVTTIISELTKTPEGGLTYDMSKIDPAPLSIALIDGPPTKICGPNGRLHPLRWALHNLLPNGKIFLDDAARSQEQECIAILKCEFPNLIYKNHFVEKGLTELSIRNYRQAPIEDSAASCNSLNK